MSEEIRKTREDFNTESEWYTYMITHPEEEEEEEKKYILYYKCDNPKCNYVSKTNFEVSESDINEFVELINNLKCPKCGNVGFTLIAKKEYEKLVLKNDKNKENKSLEKVKEEYDKMVRKAYKAKKYIMDEREDLFEDLTSKLMAKEITEKRFIYLFYNLSYAILLNASKRFKLPMVAFRKQRNNISRMCDEAIELFNIKEETDKVLETYDAREDEIYDIYYSKYMDDKNEDDRKIFLEYKRSSTLNQYNKRLEERYGIKLNSRMERRRDSKVYHLDKEFERAISDDMKSSIEKLKEK